MLKYDMPRAVDDDFVQHGETMDELTVTITLSEYRALVEDNALLRRDVPKLIEEKKALERELKAAHEALADVAPELIRNIEKALANFGEYSEEKEENEEAKP